MLFIQYKKIACLLLVLAFVATACKKSTLLTYDGTDNTVYFNNDVVNQYITTDTLFINPYSFSAYEQDSFLYSFPLSITGPAVSYDRGVKIVADPASTARAGVDYAPLPDSFYIHAGKYNDTAWVMLYNAPDRKGIDATQLLLLNIKPGLSFGTNLKKQVFSSYHTDYLRRGVNYGDTILPPYVYDQHYCELGIFTARKLFVLDSLGGFTPADWRDVPAGRLTNPNLFTYLLISFKQFLAARSDAGDPILYEDGTEMSTDDAEDLPICQ